MNWIPSIFRRRKLYGDLSEEIRLHIEERAEQLMGEGMSPKEAERQARIAFGNRSLLEERSREVWQWPTLESIWADVRFALRQLRRSPGFAIAAVLTLALAIGANAVVFAVLNGLILRPLNVPQANSLYAIEHGSEKTTGQSYPDYLDLRDHNRSFDGLAAFYLAQGRLRHRQGPIHVWAYETTETTSTCSEFSRISAASSTSPTSMARTAPRTSSSAMPIGTAVFRTIAAWWDALSSSTSILSPSSA